jgi:quercetin dioxygenase-like cupin family protein
MTESREAGICIVKVGDLVPFERGEGVETTLLIGKERVADAPFTTGLTTFPPGRAAPMHSHNCAEQVTILEGEAEVEVAGVTTRLRPLDSTYIAANLPHRFINIGEGPMKMLWIYAADHVTRTFTATGVTVEHLSGGDKV